MFMGMDGFQWFNGIVEDIHDPLKLGRVKVRYIGHHPVKKSSAGGVRTEELLWCHPVQTIADAAMNGIGQSPTGIVQGSTVFGFWRDAIRQDPLILGVIPGVPGELPIGSFGFNDPDEIYPKESHLNEPDTNRLARNDISFEDYSEASAVEEFTAGRTPYVYRPHPILERKETNRVLEVPKASFRSANQSNWSEHESSYAAVYPKNHVYESESGHITEVDDTPGAERTHDWHRSGTFSEVHPDGSEVHKIVGDDFQIVLKDRNVVVQGNLSITVIGDTNLYVQGDVVEQIDGNAQQHVKGNIEQYVEGNVTTEVDGDVSQTVHGSVDQQVDGNMTSVVNGDVNQSVHGASGLTQTVDNTVSITCTDYVLNASNSISESTDSHSTSAGTISRAGDSISDSGGGATMSLQGSASLDGTTVNLG